MKFKILILLVCITCHAGYEYNTMKLVDGSGTPLTEREAITSGGRTSYGLEALKAGEALDFIIKTADDDGTDINQIVLSGKLGWAVSPDPAYHGLQIRWNGANAYNIFTSAGSNNDIQPLQLGTHLDMDMLVIDNGTLDTTIPLTIEAGLVLSNTGNDAVIQATVGDNDSLNLKGEGTGQIAIAAGADSGTGGLVVYDGTTATPTNGDFLTLKPGSIISDDGTLTHGTNNLNFSGNLDVDTDVFNVETTTYDAVAIGTAVSGTYMLEVRDIAAAEASSFYAFGGLLDVDPTGADNQYGALSFSVGVGNSALDVANLIGTNTTVIVDSDAASNYTGTIAKVSNYETGANLGGGKAGTYTIDSYEQISIMTPTISTTGTRTITDMVGLEVKDLDSAQANWPTNVWAIRTGTGKVDLGDETDIGDGTNELQVSATGDLSFAGTATVWNDIVFPLSTGKLLGANQPDYTVAIAGNVYEYTFAISDIIDVGSQEVPHSYKEGSDFDFHVHTITNGLDATDRYVRYSIEYVIADMGEVTATATLTSPDLLIPASTTDRTHIYFDMGDITGTNYKIGATIKFRFSRVALAGAGTAPSNDPFVTMVGCHIEEDTPGSRTEAAK